MTSIIKGAFSPDLPPWVPNGALHYLAHVEHGITIRALARAAGCHASTVLRQVRRIESRRDDPLVDAALRGLSAQTPRRSGALRPQKEPKTMSPRPTLPDDTTLERDGLRVLRRLCEPGAVLAVSTQMDKAVVVRDGPDGTGLRTATVDRSVAEAMALKQWITCDQPDRISRYRITAEGRSEVGRLTAQAENLARGEADGDTGLDDDALTRRARALRAEPPLLVLSRRREKDGTRFLEPALVAAGERLREDFEIAQTGPHVIQNWTACLSTDMAVAVTGHSGGDAALGRVHSALRDLGPGLGDVALQCCCYLEGLEAIERRMGWSARSGKVVLRIALQRLKRHYDENGQSNALIG